MLERLNSFLNRFKTSINKVQFQYTMKTSHSTHSAPNPLLRKFSTCQPLAQKNHTVFITQKNQKENFQLQIAERHQQLNNYIDELDSKIKKIVEYNEAEILIAYSKHFNKVREEIQLFKEETLNQIKIESSVVERMEKMKKELIVFREQALRLFAVVLDKDKIIEEMRAKIQELESEKKFMDSRMKQIIKAVKEDKVKGITIESNDSQMEPNANKLSKFQESGNTFYSVGFYNYKKNKQFDKKMKNRTMTSSNYHTKLIEKQTPGVALRTNISTSYNQQLEQQKQIQQLQLNSLVKQKYHNLNSHVVEDIIKTTVEYFEGNQNYTPLRNTKTANSSQFQKTRFSLKSKSYYGRELSQQKKTSFSSSKNRAQMKNAKLDCKRNELIQYFQRCVNMVKQQIAHRTKRATINFFTGGEAISVQEFKKIDFIRLFELVFSDERVTNILFQSIFGRNKLSIFSQF